jgi:hypothetical protein
MTVDSSSRSRCLSSLISSCICAWRGVKKYIGLYLNIYNVMIMKGETRKSIWAGALKLLGAPNTILAETPPATSTYGSLQTDRHIYDS